MKELLELINYYMENDDVAIYIDDEYSSAYEFLDLFLNCKSIEVDDYGWYMDGHFVSVYSSEDLEDLENLDETIDSLSDMLMK